jgi:hypothetical protein
MRLIGGKDYYDGVGRYGRDTDVVFVRHKNKTMKPNDILVPAYPQYLRPLYAIKKPHLSTSIITIDHDDVKIYPIIVWFCGRRYGGVEIRSLQPGKFSRIFYDLPEFKTFVHQQGYELSLSHQQGYELSSSRWMFNDHPYWEKQFSRTITEEQTNWFIQNRITIAVRHNRRLTPEAAQLWRIDGSDLSTIAFYTVKPPHDAFQEISMWVGGIMTRPAAPMVEISDADRAAKAGFSKWSFRKPGKHSDYIP